MKKTLLSALLLSGMALIAGEPVGLANNLGGEFSNNNQKLEFRKSNSERNLLKLKNTRFSASGREWEESEVTGSGLFINLGFILPTTTYLNPYYTDGDFAYIIGTNFELGNYFRFAKIAEGKFGIGLRASWLNLSFCSGRQTDTYFGVDYENIYRATEISLVRLGPQFGMALNEKMGLDVFYQFGYNLAGEFIDFGQGSGQESIGGSSWFQGISHEIGVAFKYKVFSVGLGYRFGKLKNFLNYYDGDEYDADTDKKYSVSCIRIALGFKF